MGLARADLRACECRDAKRRDRLFLVPYVGRCGQAGFVDHEDSRVAVSIRPGTVLSVAGIDDRDCAAFSIPRSATHVIFTGRELVFRTPKLRTVPLNRLVAGIEATVVRLPSAQLLEFRRKKK